MNKVNKAREIRRRRYDQTREIQLLISTAYRTAERVAFLFIPKQCCTGGNPDEEGPLELHHINGNVLDNRVENLAYLTKSKHAKLHTLLPKINWVDIMDEALKTNQNLNQLVTERIENFHYRQIFEDFIKEYKCT